jgi:hypothetical protein
MSVDEWALRFVGDQTFDRAAWLLRAYRRRKNETHVNCKYRVISFHLNSIAFLWRLVVNRIYFPACAAAAGVIVLAA